MKKKILNALLMGVLVMTSMSVFVSCKDYDDDIDDLRVEQADLLSQLTSLQSSVDTQTSSITSQITSLQSSVSSLNSDLQGAISDAADAAQSAGAAATAAATAQSTADNAADAAAAAQATADEALAKAQEALTKASDTAAGEALTKAESALTQITTLSNKLGSLEALDNGIAGLVEQVNKAATKEELKKLQESVDKYQSYFDNLFAMVTSVELYGTLSGSDVQLDTQNSLILSLLHGNVKEDSKFGDNEAYAESNPLITYTKGNDIKQSNTGIILRVNPVNATLSTEDANCKILLINSKGESLDDYLEIASVKKYDELITTRATSINSGLWQIGIQLKDKADTTAFRNAIETKGKNILFAVAINNTDTTKADRYVASTYDLGLDRVNYVPSTDLTFSVTNNHNVAYATKLDNGKSGDEKITFGEKVILNRYDENGGTEYAWKKSTDDNPTPATAIKWNNGVAVNAAKADGISSIEKDDRTNGSALPVEVNGKFTVSLYNPGDKIDYYYVVLDKNFAEKESAPSEWNVWNLTYKYENLYKTVKASEPLELKVTEPAANGDKIGFRVFAVNYDGTLVDPDGKAFYVQVGTPSGTNDVTATITATDAVKGDSVIVALPNSFNDFSSAFKKPLIIDADKSDDVAAGGEITYELLDKDKKTLEGVTDASWEDAKFVKIKINPGKFEDGGTFVASYEAKDVSTDRTINILNVTVKKEMPTTTPELSFKTGQVVNGVYKCYLTPNVAGIDGAWNVASDNGYMNLKNVLNGLTDNANWTWTFAAAQWDGNKNADVDYKIGYGQATPTSYDVTIAKKYIDSDKQHATTAMYNYPGISYRDTNNDGKLESDQNFQVANANGDVNTIFCCPLEPSVMSFAWTQYNAGSSTKPDMKDVNHIIYGQTQAATDVLSTGIDLTNYLKATNTYDNTKLGGTWSTVYAKFLPNDRTVTPKVINITATLTSDANGKSDYYTVEVEDNGKFKFTAVPSSSNPVEESIKSTLTITTKDAYGHTNSWKLPFYVKRR